MKRFRVLFLFLPLLLSFQAAPGQGNMRFSVHASPQFAWIGSDGKTIDSDGSIFHLQAGIQMDYFFAENYAFIAGLSINNMGGDLLYADSTRYGPEDELVIVPPDQKVKMNLQYLDIPVGLKLKAEELGYTTLFLQIGLNPMFNINAHVSTKDGTLHKDNIKKSVNLFNLGFHLGAGAEYRLGGNTAAIAGIRWTSGLINVTEKDGASTHVNAISINLGILF